MDCVVNFLYDSFSEKCNFDSYKFKIKKQQSEMFHRLLPYLMLIYISYFYSWLRELLYPADNKRLQK